MPTPRRTGKRLFPNPFYVLLLVASTAFVVTILADLVAGMVHGQAEAGLGRWVEAHGTAALAIELAVMLAAGLLAMASDRWFPEKPARPPRRPD